MSENKEELKCPLCDIILVNVGYEPIKEVFCSNIQCELYLIKIPVTAWNTRTPQQITADKADGTGTVTGWYVFDKYCNKHLIFTDARLIMMRDSTFGDISGYTNFIEINPASIKPAIQEVNNEAKSEVSL